jgi:hypothetical protein
LYSKEDAAFSRGGVIELTPEEFFPARSMADEQATLADISDAFMALIRGNRDFRPWKQPDFVQRAQRTKPPMEGVAGILFVEADPPLLKVVSDIPTIRRLLTSDHMVTSPILRDLNPSLDPADIVLLDAEGSKQWATLHSSWVHNFT